MRVYGYARVSSDMQLEGFSIAAQQRAIATYCQLQGWTLETVYVDEGRSARSDDTAKRPEFARMLHDAEASQIDVIVVHKLDRFARNIITTLTTLQRLERAGIGFVSINENMDFTSPIGKAMLAMLAAFAQFYSDNLSTETKKGKAERKRQGLYNGVLPFGTTRDHRGVPVPDTEPWACAWKLRSHVTPYEGLVRAFDLAASGASDREIARALNRLGHMSSGTWGRNPMTKDAVRAILRNRFYLGELPDDDGGWIPGQHDAMIDPDTFTLAQENRSRRATGRTGSAPGTSVTPFTGLLVCGACGSPIRKQSGIYYRCARNGQNAACAEPGFTAAAIEGQILDILNALAFAPEDHATVAQLIREGTLEQLPTTLERTNIAERITRAKHLFLDGAMTIDEYRAEAARLETLENANAVYEYVTADDRIGAVLHHLSTLGNLWLVQTDAERNELLRALFAAIYVESKRVVALLPRPEIAIVLASIFRTNPRRGGSDGRPLRGCAFAPGAIEVPDVYLTPVSRYSVPRDRKLTNAQISLLRMLQGESLRDLAREFGVSHETVRTYRG